jgi:hypothetical protein
LSHGIDGYLVVRVRGADVLDATESRVTDLDRSHTVFVVHFSGYQVEATFGVVCGLDQLPSAEGGGSPHDAMMARSAAGQLGECGA